MLRAWAQLLRIPNVFTAPADVIAGAVLTLRAWPEASDLPRFLVLIAASACLYLAGMVLNDVFDVREDRRDRPFRPIPSGRIGLSRAVTVGVLLLVVGVALAGLLPERLENQWMVPVALAGLILFYDGGIKHTALGPWLMGACRGLNVLLGSLMAASWAPAAVWAAVTVALYITGVTYFARSEARVSARRTLWTGVYLMAAAFVSLVLLILQVHFLTLRGYPGPQFFTLIVLALIWGFVLSRFLARAIETPGPGQVQAAIKACILGLVALEAIHATLAVGLPGLWLLLLLPPALLLGRWVYST